MRGDEKDLMSEVDARGLVSSIIVELTVCSEKLNTQPWGLTSYKVLAAESKTSLLSSSSPSFEEIFRLAALTYWIFVVKLSVWLLSQPSYEY